MTDNYLSIFFRHKDLELRLLELDVNQVTDIISNLISSITSDLSPMVRFQSIRSLKMMIRESDISVDSILCELHIDLVEIYNSIRMKDGLYSLVLLGQFFGFLNDLVKEYVLQDEPNNLIVEMLVKIVNCSIPLQEPYVDGGEDTFHSLQQHCNLKLLKFHHLFCDFIFKYHMNDSKFLYQLLQLHKDYSTVLFFPSEESRCLLISNNGFAFGSLSAKYLTISNLMKDYIHVLEVPDDTIRETLLHSLFDWELCKYPKHLI